MNNYNIIYKAYSPETVNESLNTFADSMRGGADVKQLLCGISALDYICHGSSLTEWQQTRKESLILEANIRIDLTPVIIEVDINVVLRELQYQIDNLFNRRILNQCSTLECITDYIKASK